MERKYYIFLGIFAATVAVFIVGLIISNMALILLAFAASLALFVARRFFIPRR